MIIAPVSSDRSRPIFLKDQFEPENREIESFCCNPSISETQILQRPTLSNERAPTTSTIAGTPAQAQVQSGSVRMEEKLSLHKRRLSEIGSNSLYVILFRDRGSR
jgi:hypothetical protein